MKTSELKKEAKQRLSGKYLNLFIINFFYAIITTAFQLVSSSFVEQSTSALVTLAIEIVLIIFLIPFSYGLIVSTIKIFNNEDVSSLDFVSIGIKNIKKVWKTIFSIILKILPALLIFILSLVLIAFGIGNTDTSIIFILAIIVYIASIVYFVYKALSYSLSFYCLYDNEDKTSKEVIDISAKLMNNNKWNFVKLALSFIGWYFLLGIVCGIIAVFLPANSDSYILTCIATVFSALLAPYIGVTQVVFYSRLKDNIDSTISEPTVTTEATDEKTEE